MIFFLRSEELCGPACSSFLVAANACSWSNTPQGQAKVANVQMKSAKRLWNKGAMNVGMNELSDAGGGETFGGTAYVVTITCRAK